MPWHNYFFNYAMASYKNILMGNFYLLAKVPVTFNATPIDLYNIVPRIMFIIVAGNTTTVTKVRKLPGSPTIILADSKNVSPLTIVQKLNADIIFILSLTLFPITLNIK